MDFPDGSSDKESPYNTKDAGDRGLIPGSGRSPREGNGNPLQYSCLENSMDKTSLAGHRVKKSQIPRHTFIHSFIGIHVPPLSRTPLPPPSPLYPFRGNPFQYSFLGNPMDRGAWQAAVHGVSKSWIQLSD